MPVLKPGWWAQRLRSPFLRSPFSRQPEGSVPGGGLEDGFEDGPPSWPRPYRPADAAGAGSPGRGPLRAHCGNPACVRAAEAGWPIADRAPLRFERRAVCGRECLQALVRAALRRELAGVEDMASAYRHRLPLGLLLLSRQAITHAQLTRALAGQKAARRRGGDDLRLGEWLVRHEGVGEEAVARALAAQWGVPLLTRVLPPDAEAARLLPRLFVDVLGIAPLRLAAGRILYLAVDDQLDRCLLRSVEQMTGLAVEPGVMPAGEFARLRLGALKEAPAARLFRSGSLAALEESVVDLLARAEGTNGRLARMREYLWVAIERPVAIERQVAAEQGPLDGKAEAKKAGKGEGKRVLPDPDHDPDSDPAGCGSGSGLSHAIFTLPAAG